MHVTHVKESIRLQLGSDRLRPGPKFRQPRDGAVGTEHNIEFSLRCRRGLLDRGMRELGVNTQLAV